MFMEYNYMLYLEIVNSCSVVKISTVRDGHTDLWVTKRTLREWI